jgi:uncharacterized membrane protein YbhN (UPF0104 family)
VTAAEARPDLQPRPVDDISGRDSRRGWITTAWIAGGLALLGGAAVISAVAVDTDSGQDVRHLLGAVAHDLAHLRWQFAPIVIGFGAAHYVATALAARAAVGTGVDLRELTLVQLAAAAANRLTPAGLGGSAVLTRYLTRRGLDVRRSLGVVVTLVVLGALADVIVLTLIVAIGGVFGLGGGLHELTRLWSKLRHLLGQAASPWVAAVAGALMALVVVIWMRRHRQRRERRRDRQPGAVIDPLRELLRRPADLAILLTASGATTLILGLAFAASTHMTPGPQPQVSIGAIIVAYMVAAAAGTVVPIPAGLGSTEAALVGVLVAAQVPAAHAVQVTLVFRVITFWAPAAIGVLVTRHLRRVGAL